MVYNQMMENKFKHIKIKSLAWIEDRGMLFVVKMFDSVKKDAYYRPVGGSVEYGESAADAVKREMEEELHTKIEVAGTPLILENRFVCEGKLGHEIDFLFYSTFLNQDFYERKIFRLIEGDGKEADALWISIDNCLNGNLRLVPEALLEWYRQR